MQKPKREQNTKNEVTADGGRARGFARIPKGTPGNSLNVSFEVEVCDKLREAQRRELLIVLH